MAGCFVRFSNAIVKGTCSMRGTLSLRPMIRIDSRRPSISTTFILRKACTASIAISGRTRTAIEINCVDCHGTIRERATLMTSGFAAGMGVKDDKFAEGPKRPLANIRFRDPNGGKVALFQLIRSDTKKKDENGNDIALKAGDII